MPNDNCLAGMRCPDCESEGPFKIHGNALFTVDDTGSDDFEQVDWDKTSAASCMNCEWNGTVSGLRGGPDPVIILRRIWAVLYREDDGKINPDKEWAVDTIETVADLVCQYKKRPVLADTPGSTAQGGSHHR